MKTYSQPQNGRESFSLGCPKCAHSTVYYAFSTRRAGCASILYQEKSKPYGSRSSKLLERATNEFARVTGREVLQEKGRYCRPKSGKKTERCRKVRQSGMKGVFVKADSSATLLEQSSNGCSARKTRSTKAQRDRASGKQVL